VADIVVTLVFLWLSLLHLLIFSIFEKNMKMVHSVQRHSSCEIIFLRLFWKKSKLGSFLVIFPRFFKIFVMKHHP